MAGNGCSVAAANSGVLYKHRGPTNRQYTGPLQLSREGGVVEVKGGFLRIGDRRVPIEEVDIDSFRYTGPEED